MANLDVIAGNLDALRANMADLLARQEANGAAQEQNQGTLQRALQQRVSHPEVASLRPSNFKGLASEDADRWMGRFQSYAEYCNMDDQKKVRIFRLLVEGSAEVWLNGLEDAVKQNWGQLKEAFMEKYVNANNLTWLKEQGLLARVQDQKEAVEVYITDVRQKCNQLQKGEAETKSIILRGLLPEIKAFVIGQQPQTLDDLEAKAKLAESIENMKPKPNQDKVNMLQETYGKNFGELTKSLSALQDTVQQQSRDLQFVKNNIKSQGFTRRSNPQQPSFGRNFKPFCQRCKQYGHQTDNCVRRPQAGDTVCYNCNQRGHLKRQCPRLRRNQAEGRQRNHLNYQGASQSGAGKRPNQA